MTMVAAVGGGDDGAELPAMIGSPTQLTGQDQCVSKWKKIKRQRQEAGEDSQQWGQKQGALLATRPWYVSCHISRMAAANTRRAKMRFLYHYAASGQRNSMSSWIMTPCRGP